MWSWWASCRQPVPETQPSAVQCTSTCNVLSSAKLKCSCVPMPTFCLYGTHPQATPMLETLKFAINNKKTESSTISHTMLGLAHKMYSYACPFVTQTCQSQHIHCDAAAAMLAWLAANLNCCSITGCCCLLDVAPADQQAAAQHSLCSSSLPSLIRVMFSHSTQAKRSYTSWVALPMCGTARTLGCLVVGMCVSGCREHQGTTAAATADIYRCMICWQDRDYGRWCQMRRP